MITEDFVSFNTAKLLKEKGFDEPVKCFYDIRTEILCDNCVKTRNSYTESIAAPTLQMAMKWLRKVHNIHIEVRYFPLPNIYRYVIIHTTFTRDNIDSHPQYFNSYEEACEEAIKYCLENLI